MAKTIHLAKRPVVSYHTFGCKANQYDTERMRQELEGLGASTAERHGSAEVAVVNSCTVTNQADVDARRLVRRLKRENPALVVLVAGCSAALREDDYRAMPEVDAVVPGQDPASVAAAIAALGLVSEGGASDARDPLRRNRRGTRGWLKVQDGCDRSCSFCATRIARGVSRSRPLEEVVWEAKALAEGHPELVITGIHIGHYGRDLAESTTLGEPCSRLLEVVDARFRLSSIEATEIDDRILGLIASSDGKLAPHLHMPMQAGSDAVLRRMRRWHTREAYRARVLEIADRTPVLGLGADVIVGFPGEGDREFAETRALVEELPYTYLHVFPYSARDGTVAATLPDRVPGDVAAARSRELRELALAKGRAYRAGRAGSLADLVLEGDRRVTAGLTGDYLRVEVRGGGHRPGTRLRARLHADGTEEVNLYVCA